MGKYKLVALDMDGTVLNSQNQISDANRQAILDAIRAGITVMFATGRGIQSIIPYVEQLGIGSPIVASNGSEVWSRPHELHFRELLEVDWVIRMHQLAVAKDTWFWAYATSGHYNRENWVTDIRAVEWLKFGFQTAQPDVLAEIHKELVSWGLFELTNSHPTNIEVNPAGISKASGIAQVCSIIGTDMSRVVAIGDGLNDIAMIRAAGLGVAMGNAQEEVKEIADLVTVHHDEDGVAAVIRNYVLNENITVK